MKFIDIANRFISDIRVNNGQTTADGKSIMEMGTLAAIYGTHLTIRAEGPDAEQAVIALRELVEVRMFDEPPPEDKSQATQ
jgi:phosphotransferase system HPr (HPr) family protein